MIVMQAIIWNSQIITKLLISVFSVAFLFASISYANAQQIKVGSFVSAKGFGSRFVIMPWMERANAALKEIGSDSRNNRVLVKVDKNYFRPNEIHELRGDSSKAKKILGWKPKISFHEMVKEMVISDIEEIKSLRKKS